MQRISPGSGVGRLANSIRLRPVPTVVPTMVGTAFREAEDFGVLAAEYETLTQVAQQHRFEELLGHSGQASDQNASRTPAAPSSQLPETPTSRIESYGDEHRSARPAAPRPGCSGVRRGASAIHDRLVDSGLEGLEIGERSRPLPRLLRRMELSFSQAGDTDQTTSGWSRSDARSNRDPCTRTANHSRLAESKDYRRQYLSPDSTFELLLVVIDVE